MIALVLQDARLPAVGLEPHGEALHRQALHLYADVPLD